MLQQAVDDDSPPDEPPVLGFQALFGLNQFTFHAFPVRRKSRPLYQCDHARSKPQPKNRHEHGTQRAPLASL